MNNGVIYEIITPEELTRNTGHTTTKYSVYAFWRSADGWPNDELHGTYDTLEEAAEAIRRAG